jgi:hypothetical protein
VNERASSTDESLLPRLGGTENIASRRSSCKAYLKSGERRTTEESLCRIRVGDLEHEWLRWWDLECSAQASSRADFASKVSGSPGDF